MKQKQSTDAVQEGREPVAATYSVSKSTTKHATRTVPEVLVAEDPRPTVLLVLVAMCGAMTTVVVMLVIALISCRNCKHSSESDHHDDALCGRCYRSLFDGMRRQRVIRRTEQNVHVDSVSDCSPRDSGISACKHTVLLAVNVQ